jgi:hypothetical protein
MAPSVLEERVAVVPCDKDGHENQLNVGLTPSTDCLTELADLAVTETAVQKLPAGPAVGCEVITAIEDEVVCSSEAHLGKQETSPAEEATAGEAVDAFVALYEQVQHSRGG